MNIIDIGIIVLLIFGGILGFKRGFTTELVKTVGFIVVIILAFLLKNPLSAFLYEKLPFFNFGFLKGAAILNILVYEVIAFIICVVVFNLILKLVLIFTRIFEKALAATIILSIPSKIAGAILGLIYDYIVIFLVLYVMTLVGINVSLVSESQLREKIINNTPVLSSWCDKSVTVINEFRTLQEGYTNKAISTDEFNYNGLELFLKRKVITGKQARKLIDSGKLDKFNNYDDLLKEYEVEE